MIARRIPKKVVNLANVHNISQANRKASDTQLLSDQSSSFLRAVLAAQAHLIEEACQAPPPREDLGVAFGL